MSNNKLIKAIDGQGYPLDKCVLINGNYYLLTDNNITFDHKIKDYNLKENIVKGVIGFDKNYDPIFGNFSLVRNNFDNEIILSYKNVDFICLNDYILKESVNNKIWIENLSNFKFYKRTALPFYEFNKIKKCDRNYKNDLSYNATSSILKKSIKNFKNLFKVESYSKPLENFPQIAKDYTFGLEFETIKGVIPPRICNKLGLIPLRDGSIEGLEYVTIPHSGKNGIQALLDSLEELEKRTVFDNSCSLHMHVGNIPRTESYFCALTKVLCLLQNEIYDLFPFAMRGGLGLKKKDYTAPLPSETLLAGLPTNIDDKNVKDAFNDIFKYLSGGYDYSEFDSNLDNIISHPSDPNNNSKWYIRTRYKWVNMIPLLFGNKQTVEFRIHTPTYNKDKVINFLILCLSIIDFAKVNEKIINNGTLDVYNYNKIEPIIFSYLTQFGQKYTSLYDKVITYFQKRKRYQIYELKYGNFFADENKFNGFNNFYNQNQNNKLFLNTSLNSILNNESNHLVSLEYVYNTPESIPINTSKMLERLRNELEGTDQIS